jgi:hypothetical protein
MSSERPKFPPVTSFDELPFVEGQVTTHIGGGTGPTYQSVSGPGFLIHKDGSVTPRPEPRKIVQISAGPAFTIALTNRGELYALDNQGWIKMPDIPQD